jgi:hypothetical protein
MWDHLVDIGWDLFQFQGMASLFGIGVFATYGLTRLTPSGFSPKKRESSAHYVQSAHMGMPVVKSHIATSCTSIHFPSNHYSMDYHSLNP